jgi:outer membrane lipoprotein carrier protein
MKRAICIAALTACFLLSALAAQAADLDSVLKGVNGRYSKIKNMKASFSQTTFVKTLGRDQVKSGTVMFKRPDKMRWDYDKPATEQLLTDGFTLWIYQPEEKVVYMRKIDQVNSTTVPMQVLSGEIDAKKQFDAKIGTEADGKVALILVPKAKGAGYEKAVLTISTENFEILGIDVVDIYGNKTKLKLSSIEYNAELPDSLFVYTPKPGVEVISPPVME